MLFEVVDFVQTTRRWYRQGETLRDAGDLDACQRANRERIAERQSSSRNHIPKAKGALLRQPPRCKTEYVTTMLRHRGFLMGERGT